MQLVDVAFNASIKQLTCLSFTAYISPAGTGYQNDPVQVVGHDHQFIQFAIDWSHLIMAFLRKSGVIFSRGST